LTPIDVVVAGLEVRAGPDASPEPPPEVGLPVVPGGSYCPGTPGKMVADEAEEVLMSIEDGGVLKNLEDEDGDADERLLGVEPDELAVEEEEDVAGGGLELG